LSTSIEKVCSSTEQNPFLKHVGFEIMKCEGEEILLKLSLQKEHLNTNLSLHGGVHAAMLETVQALVVRYFYKKKSMILNLNVQYLASVKDGEICARAKLIQKGYKTAITESEIIDQNNRIIAKGTGVYKIV